MFELWVSGHANLILATSFFSAVGALKALSRVRLFLLRLISCCCSRQPLGVSLLKLGLANHTFAWFFAVQLPPDAIASLCLSLASNV